MLCQKKQREELNQNQNNSLVFNKKEINLIKEKKRG